MYCPHCGAVNDANARTCARCGQLLIVNPFAPGTIVGRRYEIVQELGRGGMGVVYLTRDRELNIPVALKTVPPEFAFDERALHDMRREVEASLRLSHPNIVRIFDLKNDGGTYFIVMEYVDGVTLRQAVHAKGKLSLASTLRVLEPAAAALDYAHSQRVIHRDVKSSNLMVTREWVVKVMDFGIARVMKDTSSRISQTATSGTLAYMSPEQVKGESLDARSDQYSLGAVAYEMLAGHPPFYTGAIDYQIVHVDPKPIEGMPAYVNGALTRCLAKNPGDRFPTVAAFVAALEGGPQAVSIEAEPAVEATPVHETPLREQKTPEAYPVLPESKPKTHWGAILSISALVITACMIISVVSKGGCRQKKEEPKRVEEKAPEVIAAPTAAPPPAMGEAGFAVPTTEKQPIPDAVRVTATGGLNVRSGPGLSYDVVGQVEYDSIWRVSDVEVNNEGGRYPITWYKISIGPDKEGWACAGLPDDPGLLERIENRPERK